MAKPNITQVTVTQTFQSWLDKTNEIVDLVETDIMTASALGDSTTGNSTLIGNFTANNMIAHDLLRVNSISPRSGFAQINANAPITINSSGSISQTLNSPVGPKQNFTSGNVTWRAGFEDTTDNNFIIDTGTGTRKLKLTPGGDLTIAGKFIPLDGIEMPVGESLTGNVIGNVTGDVFGDVDGDLTGDVKADNGTTILSNGTDGTNALFTGDVTGDVTGDIFSDNGVKVFENGANGTDAFVTGHISSISNHTTSNLREGTNLYFTDQRAIDAINNAPQGSITSIVGIKAFIAFNGSTGGVISRTGLNISKSGTGNYYVSFQSGYAPPNANYTVVLGNVDQGTTSANDVNANQQGFLNFNTFVQSRAAAGFTIRAVRTFTTIRNFADDNSVGFGIAAVDPSYITISVLY